MAGESKAWKDALTQAAKVASEDTTVLLLGESGKTLGLTRMQLYVRLRRYGLE
jgi:transcriptional regulator with AAA-type ATPase domain